MQKVIGALLIAVSFSSFSQSIALSDQGSAISFKIRNFGVTVDGTISGLSGQFIINQDTIEKSYFKAMVRAETIDTGMSLRDKHLRGESYFDANEFPVLKIESNKITRVNGMWKVMATLTMKNVARAIDFPFTLESDKLSYLFKGVFSVNRRDFDIGGNSVSLSDIVEVRLRVKGVRNL